MFKLRHQGNPLCIHCHISDAVNRWARGKEGAEYVLNMRRLATSEHVAQLSDRQVALEAVATALGTILAETLREEGDPTGRRAAVLLGLFQDELNRAARFYNPAASTVESGTAFEGSNGGPMPEPDTIPTPETGTKH